MATERSGELPDLGEHATWLRRLVRDGAMAEDAVQDTWVAFPRRPSSAGDSPRPWLATVLRNFVHQRRRAAINEATKVARAAADAEKTSPPLPTP